MCASKPADINTISGLNLSIFSKILFSNIFIKFFPSVPATIGALKMLPVPTSFSKPVPGNNGCSWIDP